jgi:soluble lytic murein transglycosylase
VKRHFSIAVCIAGLALATIQMRPAKAAPDIDPSDSSVLRPTSHPPISRDLSALWLAPAPADVRRTTSQFPGLKAGIQALKDGRLIDAIKLLAPVAATAGSADEGLANYAAYQAAVADFGLENFEQARRRLKDLRDGPLRGYLVEAAALAEADVAEAQSDDSDALEIYEELARQKTADPAEIWMRLGHAAEATANRSQAAEAYARVYYEFPFGALAADALAELDRLRALEPLTPQNARFRLDLGRAERLFAARRYADAQSAFEALRRYAVAGDRDLIALRLAECDFFQRRYRQAREALGGLTDQKPRQAEAQYFYSVTLQRLGLISQYMTGTRELIDTFPDSSWSEDALNDLTTYFIKQDDDAAADEVMRELFSKFPAGRYAARAGWKIGWRAYRAGRYAEAISYFESAARQFPRSDYRPSLLYWSARAYDAMGDTAAANARYTLTTTDYLNTYYGRLASDRLTHRRHPVALTQLQFTSAQVDANSSPKPPTHTLIRSLLALGLYDEAMDELRYAQRTWGDSPVIQATMGWIYGQEGEFRDAIAAVKRAYPQYMASGGELLPEGLLKVIFPLDYWDDIRAQAQKHNLDPYLMAALVAQESAFDPQVKSSAKAVGLMQLLPSTGRMYVRRLQLGRYRGSMLTTAKTNLTLGSAYFADLMKKFGDAHFALAAYNAGDSRVARWIAERAGQHLDREEFIDDIPFAETQAYVRKILSTAQDYRRLYGESSDATR